MNRVESYRSSDIVDMLWVPRGLKSAVMQATDADFGKT